MHRIWTEGHFDFCTEKMSGTYLLFHSGELKQKEAAQRATKGYSQGQRENYFGKLKCSCDTLLFGGGKESRFFLLLNSVGEISGLSSF